MKKRTLSTQRKPQSGQAAKPSARSLPANPSERAQLARTLVVGFILALLVLCVAGSLVWRPEAVHELLVVIGTALGYLAGKHEGRSRP